MSFWSPTGVSRQLNTVEEQSLFSTASEFAKEQLEPLVAEYESTSIFPRDQIRHLGALGLLTLPYSNIIDPDQPHVPYRISLQLLEEISRTWLTVGVSMSVHHLACAPLIRFGDSRAQDRWMQWTLSGDTLGAYCLSEPQSGSDAAALQTTAVLDGSHYILNGTKAWITHAGVADFYIVFARTGTHKTRGITCFFIPSDTPGLEFGTPEHKMALNASPTGEVILHNVRISEDHRIGQEGQGFEIALSSLDIGRLGISACAVGLGQAALDKAVSYSREREAFGQPIGSFQGVGFLLADMATAIQASRSLYIDAATRLDSGEEISAIASMAKLLATDSTMNAAVNAVQILGGNGYTQDYHVERFMREAKVLQIVEGTNQIQRLVISRSLVEDSP